MRHSRSIGRTNPTGEAPGVQLCVPAEETFLQRNELLNRLKPQFKLAGFTDCYEGEGDPVPCCPLWKNIRLEFNEQTGFHLPARGASLEGFQGLMAVEKAIDEAIHSMPPPPPSFEHKLKTVAVLDLEWKGSEPARIMTELAIVNVASDSLKDEIVGVIQEYEYLGNRDSNGRSDCARFVEKC